jgi:transposase
MRATPLEELYIIGVDELSFRRHHEYVTVVVDHLKKRVVWVGEGKGEKTLLAFFDELGPERSQALTHVTMDMSAAYRAAVEARAPQAQKVFDRFHVQKLASEAVDTVRRQEAGRRDDRSRQQTHQAGQMFQCIAPPQHPCSRTPSAGTNRLAVATLPPPRRY